MPLDTRHIARGGGGVAYLTPAGTASWTPAATGQVVTRVKVMTAATTFSALTPADDWTGSAALQTVELAVQDITPVRLKAVTITAGSALVWFS